MSAIVEICESNGAGQVVSHGITNSNMGSADIASLDPVVYAVRAGQNTYEKWQRLHVTNMAGSTKINNLKIWRTGALGGAAVHKTNARMTAYGGAAAYATPTSAISTIATQTMPTAEPATANLGIGGSLTGSLTAAGYSDYLVHQIQTNSADREGSSSVLNYQYDEIA